MAAVEVLEIEELESPPHLRLVVPDVTPRPLRTGPTLAKRRAARKRMMQRRRRTLVALGLVVGLAILSWPGHAFGGTTGSDLPGDLASSADLASGMVYVVQPGDTLTSISTSINPMNPAAARTALVHELRTSVVVPGEHVLIP